MKTSTPVKSLLRLSYSICLFIAGTVHSAPQPNVLFIAVDDLNDWIGCMGGHPQTKTPNLDRLAKSGVLFKNAYCPAASCNPSRTAIFSGLPPHRSGLYRNQQKMREVLPEAELLPRYFANNGYWAAGSMWKASFHGGMSFYPCLPEAATTSASNFPPPIVPDIFPSP